MDRLTKRTNGTVWYKYDGNCHGVSDMDGLDTLHVMTRLAAYEDTGTPEQFAELMQAKKDGRVVILPVARGERVYIAIEYEEDDGEVVQVVEETNLAGFINEDGRPFYLCYSPEYGSCDVEPGQLFLTRAEAEAALRKENDG